MGRPTLEDMRDRVRQLRELEEVLPLLRDALEAAIEHAEDQQEYWSAWGVTDDDEHDRDQFDVWCERRGALEWLARKLNLDVYPDDQTHGPTRTPHPQEVEDGGE